LRAKKISFRAQGTIDISHESDYSGSIEAKIGDASEYFCLVAASRTERPYRSSSTLKSLPVRGHEGHLHFTWIESGRFGGEIFI